jgi:hypothetical protein
MGIIQIIFVRQHATPYSLVYLMDSPGIATTILPSATLIADAQSARTTYPNFSGSPLLEVLRTPVADDVEANNIMSIGAAPPSIAPLRHCWLLHTPLGGNQEWELRGTRDAVSGLPEITVVSGGVGAAKLWIRRQHSFDM